MGRAAETPREDWDKIAFAIRQIRLRLDELERPTGSQRMNAGARLQAIEAAVEERWINDEIETRIQTAVNAALAAAFSGNVQITGSLTVNGALAAASLSTAGTLTVGGAVTLPGAASATQTGTTTPAVYGAGGKLGRA